MQLDRWSKVQIPQTKVSLTVFNQDSVLVIWASKGSDFAAIQISTVDQTSDYIDPILIRTLPADCAKSAMGRLRALARGLPTPQE